jgi:hypothetical protein
MNSWSMGSAFWTTNVTVVPASKVNVDGWNLE